MTTIPLAILFILKILILLGFGIYTIFAAILVRQERLMAHVLEESFEPILRFLVMGHLIVAIGICILALLLL